MNRLAQLVTRLAVERGRLVLACGAIVTVIGIALASRLVIRTDLEELLPSRAPSAIALHRLARRVGGTGNVAIALESTTGSPDALRAYMPRLAAALRAGLGADLLSLRFTRKDVDEYYRKYAAYYVSLPKLENWSRALSTALAKQNPAYVELDTDAPDPLRELAADVRRSREETGPHQVYDRETGLLMTERGRLGVIFVRPASTSLDLGGAGGMLRRIDAIIASTHPDAAGVRLAGYTGSIPVALAEVAAIRNDIVSTALIVVIGVALVMLLYFRSLRELALVATAVVFGCSVALGFAELWLGYVNAQTAFLGAIIAGTGINYGIIFLDRYRQSRARTPGLDVAIHEATAQTMRATGIAALATAISFGVLGAGQIESFRQFGWIGGIGILSCWIGSFTIVPACVALVDRHGRRRRERDHARRAFAWLGRGVQRAPELVSIAVLATATACFAIAWQHRDRSVETDLSKLGTKSSASGGIEALDNRLRDMDDRSSTPAVIATASRDESRQVCDILDRRAHGDLQGILRRCYSLDTMFPGDLDQRLPLLDKVRDNLDAVDEDDLDPADRADLAELRRDLSEKPPDVRDLPASLAEYFVERDGSIGKLAFVEPNNEHIERNLYAFTDAMREVRLPSGKLIESSGDLVVFADVLRAMRHDATRLTIASIVLVLLTVAVAVRRAGSFMRVSVTMLAAVACMLGIAVLLGEKLNFFNFVALPTTFGIGVDYAINVDERIRQRGRAALPEALAESGPAVVLASLTSIIGYASLLPADSRALASFGSLAILGELACVVLAVVLLPALWVD